MTGLTKMKHYQYLLIILIAGILTAGLAAPAWANPALRVDQTVPNTFIDNSAGETYQATITNVGDITAQFNSTNPVTINLPSGFYYIGTPTAIFKTGTSDPGTALSITVTGSNPVNITFNSPVSLAPGQIVVINYQLATTLTVTPGNSSANTLTVNEYYSYIDVDDNLISTNESYQSLIYVAQGVINVTLTPVSPSPFQASRGGTVTLEATLTNSGDGPLYNVSFNAAWGPNFSTPVLVGGNITPVLSGNSYLFTTGIADAIQPGASVWFEYQLTVSDYHSNFSLTSAATSNPASPGTGSASVIFDFIVNQPNISITPNAITMDYGTAPSPVTINITNNGAGPARQFQLNTNINSMFTVSNLAGGWTYDGNGNFTYTANGGEISPGNSAPLTFNVTPANPAAFQADPSTGSIMITPSYLNDIDQSFSYPVVYLNYTITNVPILGLAQTITTNGTSGDNTRLYLGNKSNLFIPRP